MKKLLVLLFGMCFATILIAGPEELKSWNKMFQAAEGLFNSASQYSSVSSFQDLIKQIVDLQQKQALSAEENDLLERSLDYLGQAFFNNNEPEKAKEAFTRLIRQNPNYKLDEDMVSPKIVDFFSQIKRQSLGTLTVSSNPVGADIKLDGKTIGKTNLDRAFASKGEHTVEISKPGYETITKTVQVSTDGARIQVQLEQTSLVSSEMASLLQENPELREVYERAMTSFSQTGDRGVLAKAVESIGDRLLADQNPEAAAKFYEEAVAALREVGDKTGLARALNSLGVALLKKGDVAGAGKKFDEAMNLCRESGDRSCVGRTLLNTGEIQLRQKDLAGARSRYEEAMKIFQETGDQSNVSAAQAKLKELAGMRRGEITALLNKGTTLLSQGNLTGAKSSFEDGLTIAREAGDQKSATIALLNLAVIFGQQGSPEAAAKFEEALSISRQNGDKANMTIALLGLGFHLAGRGDYASARDKYQEALQLSRETGDKPNEALSLYSLGVAVYSLGDPGQADALYQQSVAIYKEIGQTPRNRPW